MFACLTGAVDFCCRGLRTIVGRPLCPCGLGAPLEFRAYYVPPPTRILFALASVDSGDPLDAAGVRNLEETLPAGTAFLRGRDW